MPHHRPRPLALALALLLAIGSWLVTGPAVATPAASEPVLTPVMPGTPVVTGSAAVGGTLGLDPGSWEPVEVTLAHQWLVDDVPLPGATDDTLTLGAGLVGTRISVRVTGTAADHEPATVTSEKTGPVAKGPFLTDVPVIHGVLQVGERLTVERGTWVPEPEQVAYIWLDDRDNPLGRGPELLLAPEWAGRGIQVKVNGESAAHRSGTGSEVGGPIRPGDLTTGRPSVSGTFEVGRTLSVDGGEWAPADTDLGYQWLRGTDPIAGATGTEYTLTEADEGSPVGVRVTGTRTGYTSAQALSGASVVAPAPLVPIEPGTPVVSGTARVGQTLTGATGTWAPSDVVLTRAWLVDGRDSGRNGPTFTLTSAHVGKRISLRVTGTLAGRSAQETSLPTGVVVEVTPAVPLVPTLPPPAPVVVPGKVVLRVKGKGRPRAGTRLRAEVTGWVPGSVVAIQWLRNGTVIRKARSATYTVRAKDRGTKLQVRVRITAPGAAPGTTPVVRTSKKVKVSRVTVPKRRPGGRPGGPAAATP